MADIANDEAKTYRKVFDQTDQKELSRAIGLAAHGVGIGSFVYMRRVFERLIDRRHKESGLAIPDFQSLRMTEKIEALKAHLPEFLVSNRRMYGILSLGIHQLTEEECLSYYEVLHESIITILEDDRRKQEDQQRRKRLTAAISQIKNTPGAA